MSQSHKWFFEGGSFYQNFEQSFKSIGHKTKRFYVYNNQIDTILSVFKSNVFSPHRNK